MALTMAAINAAKPTSKPFKMADEKGLYLLVHPNGSLYWRMDYRFAGKRKTLALGVMPETTLKEAREKRDEARKQISDGIDPVEARKTEKYTVIEQERQKSEAAKMEQMIQAGELLPGSFAAVAEEWAEKFLADKSEKYRDKVLRRLSVEVFPHIGNKQINEVNAPEILALLQRIESRGIFETTHRIKQNIGQVMRYAIATGRATNDPTQALRGALAPNKATHLASLTEPKDIAPLLRVMATYEGSPITRAALTIAPLVFVRPGELRHMQWADIDWEAAEWRYTTPKTKQDHIVPLAHQVVKTLRELQPLTGHARYVFPGARSDTRPMSENTVNAALRRLGIDTQTEITGHGFRAMARTVLEEVHGFRPEVIELQLAHAVRDPLGRAYNRTKHLPERKRMMQTWADYLDELRNANNVIHANFGREAV